MERSRIPVLFLFLILGLLVAVSETETATPILCRPDQWLEDQREDGTDMGAGGNHSAIKAKCHPLKKSISVLVKEILDQTVDPSTSSSFMLQFNGPEFLNSANTVNLTAVGNTVHVSDLFIQNLAFINEANMTDCIAMSACMEHCYSWQQRNADERRHEQTLVDRMLDMTPSSVSKDDHGDDGPQPDFVRVIMAASRRGMQLAQRREPNQPSRQVCIGCQNEYAGGCPPLNYAYTVRINALYRKLIEDNVTFVDLAPKLPQNLAPELLYYHYSMHFVDRANLTTCYALVSCENTCRLYHATMVQLGGTNLAVEPPAKESNLLKGDPNKCKAIDIIHHGALVGYELATDGSCHGCRAEYPGCTDDRYEIARASAAIFGN